MFEKYFKNGYNIVKKIHKIECQKKSVTQNFKHILQAKITLKKYIYKKRLKICTMFSIPQQRVCTCHKFH